MSPLSVPPTISSTSKQLSDLWTKPGGPQVPNALYAFVRLPLLHTPNKVDLGVADWQYAEMIWQ